MEDNRTENAGLELAVNTDFAGESTRLEQIRTTLERIAQAGFSHIHRCHEWDREYMYSPYEMQQIREWMDEYGLKSKALHSTKGSAKDVNVREGHYRKDYTSDWEYNRRAGVDLIKNRVDLAQALGAAEIVLHLYVPYITIQKKPEVKEDFYACVCRSLDELMPYCLDKKVRICTENLFDMPGEYMLEAWERLFERCHRNLRGQREDGREDDQADTRRRTGGMRQGDKGQLFHCGGSFWAFPGECPQVHSFCHYPGKACGTVPGGAGHVRPCGGRRKGNRLLFPPDTGGR